MLADIYQIVDYNQGQIAGKGPFQSNSSSGKSNSANAPRSPDNVRRPPSSKSPGYAFRFKPASAKSKGGGKNRKKGNNKPAVWARFSSDGDPEEIVGDEENEVDVNFAEEENEQTAAQEDVGEAGGDKEYDANEGNGGVDVNYLENLHDRIENQLGDR